MSHRCNSTYRLRYWNCKNRELIIERILRVATAPTVYGIETHPIGMRYLHLLPVATAPTVYGIETAISSSFTTPYLSVLQQHLPFTVLNLLAFVPEVCHMAAGCNSTYRLRYWNSIGDILQIFGVYVATAPTVYGIETRFRTLIPSSNSTSCNSTYRLRYWNASSRVSDITDLISCNSTYRLRYWNFLELTNIF